MAVFDELRKAVAKAQKFNVQAFEVKILADDGRVLKLAAYSQKIAAAENRKHEASTDKFNFADYLNEYIRRHK